MTVERLANELRAYLGGIPRDLRENGIEAAPLALLQVAKLLAWNGGKLDAAAPHALSLRALGEEINTLAILLCEAPHKPIVPTKEERIARLEAELAAVRQALANRKGEVL